MEAKKVVLLAIASDFNVVKNRKYAFNFWITPDEAVRVLLEESERRGYKNMARINSIHEGIFAYKAAFDSQNNNRFNFRRRL